MPPFLIGLLTLITVFTFQAVLVPYLKIGNAQPDILYIVVAVYGFTRGPFAGSLMGFSAGFLQDLLTPNVFGVQALVKTLIGYFAGLVERTIFSENPLWPIAAIFLSSLFGGLGHVTLLYLLGFNVAPIEAFLSVVLPSALYNSVLTPFIFGFLSKIAQIKQDVTVIK